MAKLITEEDTISDQFNKAVTDLRNGGDTDSKEYFSPLANYCVTSDNMKFGDYSGEANLLIGESYSGEKCYALAYYAKDDELSMVLEDSMKGIFDYEYLASGTGSVANGNTTNISLTLTGATTTNKLRFKNPNIVQITDSSGDDEIYIDSEGVDSGATLDFSNDGTDTIKFNGPTTVNAIRGG